MVFFNQYPKLFEMKLRNCFHFLCGPVKRDFTHTICPNFGEIYGAFLMARCKVPYRPGDRPPGEENDQCIMGPPNMCTISRYLQFFVTILRYLRLKIHDITISPEPAIFDISQISSRYFENVAFQIRYYGTDTSS